MTKSRTTDLDLPQGIHRAANNRFSASYNTQSLGVFDTLTDALHAYNKSKYEALCMVAEEYKEIIPNKLYEALYNWIPAGTNNLKVKDVSTNKTA